MHDPKQIDRPQARIKNIAHELNNVLCIINGWTELLNETAEPEKDMEALKHTSAQIQKATLRAERLLKELSALIQNLKP